MQGPELTNVLAGFAIALNWAIAFLGMPHQIWKNWKAKNTEGLSMLTFSLYLIAFGFGLAYGVVIDNPAFLWGNVPLVVFSVIIFVQILYYRRPTPRVPKGKLLSS